MAEGWINYNLSYFILVLPVVIISFICSARVKSAYQKYSGFNNSRGGCSCASELRNYQCADSEN